ncbi:hypothetical protein CDD83_7838 [Cordyceps sp. RAO-2017]|nr:hypothetical protein CDD83_7838 [Cordyceps sp. RAO-2017]
MPGSRFRVDGPDDRLEGILGWPDQTALFGMFKRSGPSTEAVATVSESPAPAQDDQDQQTGLDISSPRSEDRYESEDAVRDPVYSTTTPAYEPDVLREAVSDGEADNATYGPDALREAVSDGSRESPLAAKDESDSGESAVRGAEALQLEDVRESESEGIIVVDEPATVEEPKDLRESAGESSEPDCGAAQEPECVSGRYGEGSAGAASAPESPIGEDGKGASPIICVGATGQETAGEALVREPSPCGTAALVFGSSMEWEETGAAPVEAPEMGPFGLVEAGYGVPMELDAASDPADIRESNGEALLAMSDDSESSLGQDDDVDMSDGPAEADEAVDSLGLALGSLSLDEARAGPEHADTVDAAAGRQEEERAVLEAMIRETAAQLSRLTIEDPASSEDEETTDTARQGSAFLIPVPREAGGSLPIAGEEATLDFLMEGLPVLDLDLPFVGDLPDFDFDPAFDAAETLDDFLESLAAPAVESRSEPGTSAAPEVGSLPTAAQGRAEAARPADDGTQSAAPEAGSPPTAAQGRAEAARPADDGSAQPSEMVTGAGQEGPGADDGTQEDDDALLRDMMDAFAMLPSSPEPSETEAEPVDEAPLFAPMPSFLPSAGVSQHQETPTHEDAGGDKDRSPGTRGASLSTVFSRPETRIGGQVEQEVAKEDDAETIAARPKLVPRGRRVRQPASEPKQAEAQTEAAAAASGTETTVGSSGPDLIASTPRPAPPGDGTADRALAPSPRVDRVHPPLPDRMEAEPTTAPPTSGPTDDDNVAPISMGGLLIPGGNVRSPAAASTRPPSEPATPRPDDPSPDPRTAQEKEEEKRQKLLRQAKALRNRKAQVFHNPKKNTAPSTAYGTRAAGSADRERQFRSSQTLQDLNAQDRMASEQGSDTTDHSPRQLTVVPGSALRAVEDEEEEEEEPEADERPLRTRTRSEDMDAPRDAAQDNARASASGEAAESVSEYQCSDQIVS